MELDTGAVPSVMSLRDYERNLQHVQLQKMEKSLTAYGGATLPVVGSVNVDVTHNGQCVSLPLVIVDVKEYAPPLLGRLWLQQLRLDWPTLLSDGLVKHVRSSSESLEGLLQNYQDVFKPGLGTVKGVTASLKIKDNSVPVYCRPRPVPFALRSAVVCELDRMQKEGIIYPVDHSE
jgi:hypothetical protein